MKVLTFTTLCTFIDLYKRIHKNESSMSVDYSNGPVNTSSAESMTSAVQLMNAAAAVRASMSSMVVDASMNHHQGNHQSSLQQPQGSSSPTLRMQEAILRWIYLWILRYVKIIKITLDSFYIIYHKFKMFKTFNVSFSLLNDLESWHSLYKTGILISWKKIRYKPHVSSIYQNLIQGEGSTQIINKL